MRQQYLFEFRLAMFKNKFYWVNDIFAASPLKLGWFQFKGELFEIHAVADKKGLLDWLWKIFQSKFILWSNV